MPRFTFHATPNPNSLKITSSGGTSFISAGMASFNSAEEAVGHDLGAALFAIEGVANVFILPQFLTVTKHPDVRWKKLQPAIEAVLQTHV